MSLSGLDRYDQGRVRQVGGHAVVLGASVAGLLAARVLADAFEQVTVLDRDPLDDDTEARRGVPQGQHVHALMVAGRVIMEDLLPGLTEDLVAAGAVQGDLSNEFHVHAAGDFIAHGAGGIPMFCASRPVLERLLRTRLTGHDGVSLMSGCQVTDRLADDEGGSIVGVVALQDGEQREIRADLVVDATGRRSRTATWLEQLGYPAPATETVHVDLAYRTCRVQRPPEDRLAMLVMPSAPRARGGAVLPVENDRWLVTLFGMHGDHPPDDHAGLRDFAASLPTPEIREILEDHELAVPEIAHYRFPSNTRHRYDKLDEHPRGLLCLGDAVASFNPIYGQGMSAAALQALALHHTLADEDVEHLAPRFYGRAGKIIEGVWNVAAGGDFQFPQTEGPKPPGTEVVNRYIGRLHRKAHADGELADAFSRVAAMEEPPTSLFRPRIAWRVLRPGGSGGRARQE